MKLIKINNSGLIPFVFIVVIAILPFVVAAQKSNKPDGTPETIVTNQNGMGPEISLEFTKGVAHNHPLLAIWIEDTTGNYIQTLYVSRSIAKGVFNYGDDSKGNWEPGEIRRPAALPYWAHKRGIKAPDGLYLPTPDNPVPDAYSGATPQDNFILHSKLDRSPPQVFTVLLEINQPWDWNDYWTNNRFPGNEEYKTSAQPAVVYSVRINMKELQDNYSMKLAGHSHYAGEDGKLYPDISTLSTAAQIAGQIVVSVK
ncbi:MAG: hypothetical protein KDC05_09670 [Bacteroidales bacterium]|nr:hypothetical protein [Bacteroidales bacterium]